MKNSEKEGVLVGQVIWLSGNQMPTFYDDEAGEEAPEPDKGEGVLRTMMVYPVFRLSEVSSEGGFMRDIPGDAVKVFETDDSGKFSISLPVGTYTLLSKEEQGLYANLFDGDGRVFVVDILEGKETKVEFLINYQAFY